MEHIFTDANFKTEVLQSLVPVFVDFWAPWCGPCRITSPLVDELAREYANKSVKIGKVNVDENGDIASQFKIMSIPTFFVFKNGQIVGRLVGAVSKSKLKELIDSAL